MKFKAAVSIIVVGMLLLSLCGCQLKKPESEIQSTEGDRLIGTVITTESLNTFDFESYIKDNMGDVVDSVNDGEFLKVDGERSTYENKIYARKVSVTDTGEDGTEIKHEEYVFDEVEGFWIFDAQIPETETENSYTCLCSEGGLSDVHSKIASNDSGVTSLELTASLYYSYEMWGTVFYMNPVYQESDGDIYVVEGFGYAVSGDKGSIDGDSSGSQSISDKVTVNENGEETTTESTVTINFVPVYVPEEISFIFMNDDNEAVDEKSFVPEKVPESIDVPKGTQYIITLQKSEEGSQADVVGKGYYSAEYIMEEKDGICTKASVSLIW